MEIFICLMLSFIIICVCWQIAKWIYYATLSYKLQTNEAEIENRACFIKQKRIGLFIIISCLFVYLILVLVYTAKGMPENSAIGLFERTLDVYFWVFIGLAAILLVVCFITFVLICLKHTALYISDIGWEAIVLLAAVACSLTFSLPLVGLIFH